MCGGVLSEFGKPGLVAPPQVSGMPECAEVGATRALCARLERLRLFPRLGGKAKA
jgi:hypothetical protein